MSGTTTLASTTKAALLNEEEDALSDQFEAVLEDVFRRFALASDGTEATAETDVHALGMTKKELDAFSDATNGAAMTQETYDEICEYFTLVDDTKEGDARALSFKGFYELYAMQTPNDEEESWKDIKAWGYDEQLNKVPVAAEADKAEGAETAPAPTTEP